MLTGIPLNSYLEILGHLFTASEEQLREYWNFLGKNTQDCFLDEAEAEEIGAFCLLKLGKLLSGERQNRLIQHRNQIMLAAMQNEFHLKKLFLFFEERGIRFAPFKGADLAYRIYPSPSMRPYGDFDIFFHPDDIDRARQELIADGWCENGHVSQAVHHHYAPLLKGKIMLEPHWTLSAFGETSPLDIWKHLIPVEGTRHILSPELNLLALTRHASGGQYRVIPLSRLLLDCAMVIQNDGCDWQKLRQLSRELHQPYAGNLLAAFPEFFPSEMVDQMQANQQASQAYRQIFETRDEHKELNTSEVTVRQGGIFTLHWWKVRFSMLHPANIRKKFKLHKKGDYTRLVWAYVRDLSQKSWQFIRYSLFPQRKTIAYLKLIERAEKQ